ncbi:MAG: hypothetical protein R3A78_15575 [Polyangiales bacterium]
MRRFWSDEPDPAWGGVLELVAIGGSPKVNEVIFLHKPSRTLIVCDLMMQVLGNVSFLSRVMWKLNGVYGHAGRSFVSKRLLRDPSAAHAGVERVRSWEFDRILLAHRDSVDQDGKRVFLRAFEGL